MKAGPSVTTGSVARFIAAIASSSPASRGSAATRRRLSRRRGRVAGRTCGVSERTATIPATTARYEHVLTPNAHAGPAVLITTVASNGPTARPTLNVTEFNASAVDRRPGSTSDGTKAIIVGVQNAFVTLRVAANAISSAGVIDPVATSAVSVAVTTVAATCVVIRTRRRSKRSATLPVHGARNITAAYCANPITPSRNAEWVRR